MSQGIENGAPLNMRHFGAYMDEALNFSINGVPRPSQVTPDNIVYQPSLAIYSSDERVLVAIQRRIINGNAWNLNDVFLDPPVNRYREWYLKTGDSVVCFRFVRWIKPHLTFKQVQAKIFDEFLRQKREVRRYTQGLVKVPPIYDSPYERMEVEEDLQQRLLQVKSEIAPETSLADPERLAGTIDADMSLGLYVSKDRPRAPHLLEFIARGTMISTRLGLLEALYREYGGTKPVKNSEVSVTKVAVPTFKWQINGYNLGKLLSDIEPHLVFKKAQARFIMEFLSVRKALIAGRTFTKYPLIVAQRTSVLQSFLDEWQNIDPLPLQDSTVV